ncbi:hypothetical protein BCR36DRAFT_411705 [Piromyces finnis]|uniref:Microtubule associated protein n=1 Tax=Piromyces finnis TaxID=1754191 RepID=A0A1Y1VD47_9FUNG|nr:hypothetical protein BCR36DRAFT_411705 [Piromyces finnis]|eukprot:ORX52265.1 hypothetical protein BCR36DRAFT_411705 [Piromyces finnis]
MNKIYEQLDEIKLLWKQLKHYDTKKSSLTSVEENSEEETEEEILSGPEAIKKLKSISEQLVEIIKNENQFKDKIIKQIQGIISSVKYLCEILSLDKENYKNLEEITNLESLIDKKKKLQDLELKLNHMVSERKSIIKELKKNINSIYLELGELANIDEDIKFSDLSIEYINSLKTNITQLKIQQTKNINNFIFKTRDYYLLKEKLKYSTFFQENIDSLKFRHIDGALSNEDISLAIKLFLNKINELKLNQSIIYSSQSKNISLKSIIDDIIENYFNETNIKIEKISTAETINTKPDIIYTLKESNYNGDAIQVINDDDNNNDDTKTLNIPKSISTAVVNHLNYFKGKLPKQIKLTTEFIQYLNDVKDLMEDKLNYYIKQIEIILKNIGILYDDLKIEKSKRLKLEVDKLENIPIYEEELKNLSKIWQDTQKEKVDNAYNKLKQLMNKCCLSKEEIDEINSNLTNLYLPSSLEFINNEIERLSNHYEKYKVIYQLIDERYTLIEKMIKFEETASDPMRLKGSSFRLIEEEKFRKNSFPTLVRLEEKLKDYLMNEEFNDFCYEGQIYFDILENEIENRVFNEAMFHINNQITYRPKRRIINVDKKKLKPEKGEKSILKSPKLLVSPSSGNNVKKTTTFKTATLSPSNIPIANNSTIVSPSSAISSNNRRKRKSSISTSFLSKKCKTNIGIKPNRKSLPTSLEVIKKTENTKPNKLI